MLNETNNHVRDEMEFNEQLITQLTRIEDKLQKLSELKDVGANDTPEFKKPARPKDMPDEQYEKWAKDCELRAWV